MMERKSSVKISRRAAVRYVSFFAATALALSVVAFREYNTSKLLTQQLTYSYLRSVEDLSSSVDNIKNTLNKSLYANSPALMGELSGKLWSDSNAAKMSISSLPLASTELNLSNTYKFLSQVGNYSKAMAKKFADGEELTAEDKDNILKLYQFAAAVSESLWNIESQIQGGWLTFDKAKGSAAENDEAGAVGSSSLVSGSFADVESGFDNYPTLIYDGPFSDHIMQKEPLMTKNKDAVTKDEALVIAQKSTGISSLKFTDEEGGKLPCYIFKNQNASVRVTKNGGLLASVLNYRAIDQKADSYTKQQAVQIAADFIKEKSGYKNLTDTYYETRDGVCIINFAGTEGGVTLYTDLIKVGVALDTGEVLTFDACGYITNHQTRDLKTPKLSEAEAREKLSKYLMISGTGLCVIPSEGLNERYCYEFKCKTQDGQNLLIYINADTGAEEQILILQISNDGVLTV